MASRPKLRPKFLYSGRYLCLVFLGMISTPSKKRGRPAAIFRMRDGTPVAGLLRRADGRWKVSATGQTFMEPDEARAVDRFREMTGQKVKLARMPVATVTGEGNTVSEAIARRVPKRIATIIP